MVRQNSKKARPGLFVLFFIAVQLVFSLDSVHAANRLYDLRHWSGPTHTRIVLDLKHIAEYKSFVLTHPSRLVLDLKNFDGHIPKQFLKVSDGIVKNVRIAKRTAGVIRLVIDLEKTSDHKIFPLKKNNRKPPRLVIDITRTDLEKTLRRERQQTKKRKKQGDYIVVVDPGHGGEDPGAVNRKGMREKDVVLKIARNTVRRLNRQTGIKAYLTRKGDYFISLQKRVTIAKEYGADIFISIHADSCFSTRAYGSSVYCLSFKGASSNTARMVARKENASDIIGGVPLDHKNSSLNKVIFDLVQTHSLNSSLDLARIMLKEISTVNHLHKKTPPQANFAVLRAPDIPSILIETDFISNIRRAERMQTRWFQDSFSRCITAGVMNFIAKTGTKPIEIKPPLFRTVNAGARVHRVRKNETLSGIAEKYKVSLKDLLRLNRLSSKNFLKIDQKLKIPQDRKKPEYHVVKRGETLSGIALKYGMSLSELGRLNRLSRSSTLYIGKKLVIHAPATPKPEPLPRFHTVKRGETLSGIAVKYGLSVRQLKNINGLSSKNFLKIGQQLKIDRTPEKPEYHIVKRGETLSGIAAKYGMPLSRIRKLNRLSRSNLLYAGKKLTIRSSSQSPGTKPFTGFHTVKKGETLSGIALKYNITVSRLRELNALPIKKSLYAGTRLRVSSSAKPIKKYHRVKKGETLSGIALKYSTTLHRLRHLNNLSASTPLRAGVKLRIL